MRLDWTMVLISVGSRTRFCRGLRTNSVLTSTRFSSLEVEVEQVCDFIAKSNSLVVITGAGLSTNSGIPDYRGENGAYKKGHKPQTHQDFMGSVLNRRRYWARSLIGWGAISQAKPNGGHYALARLEQNNKIKGIITQNVDRLHSKAGSQRVVELHGRSDRVSCMSCSLQTSRKVLHQQLELVNTKFMGRLRSSGIAFMKDDSSLLRPDGDAFVPLTDELDPANFCLVSCPACGGILKPQVTFFGDNVDPKTREDADFLVSQADSLLVVGSSLEVFSVYRYFKRRQGDPTSTGKGNSSSLVNVAVVNQGPTRLDREIEEGKIKTLDPSGSGGWASPPVNLRFRSQRDCVELLEAVAARLC